jgi:hypothetical protein
VLAGCFSPIFGVLARCQRAVIGQLIRKQRYLAVVRFSTFMAVPESMGRKKKKSVEKKWEKSG